MVIPNFQTSTSVHPHLAKMAARVQILSDITTVIALLDGLEQLAKVNCYI